VIDRARNRLNGEFERADKGRHFKLLAGHLTGSGEARPYGEIAEDLGTTEAAVKMSVSRMRHQYGRALRDEIADTIDDPAEVDAEVRHLLSIL